MRKIQSNPFISQIGEIKVNVNDEVTSSILVNGSLKHFVIKMCERTIRSKRIVLATNNLVATLAQLVEHHFRKVGVPGSILGGGSLIPYEIADANPYRI